jgi:hypothetical protein
MTEPNLERLILDVKESLERQINEGFTAVNRRFDTQAARLDRQGALIQTGSRWTAKINEWSEKLDLAMEEKNVDIGDLRRRIEKLEAEKGKQ